MVIQTEIEIREIEQQYSEIIKLCVRCKSDEDKIKIKKAFDLANDAHKAMRRRSGEPYIYHPIEVAKIVTGEMGLGTTSVMCALLHDVVEDTDYTVDDMENMFGKKVSSIIDGLTKISDVFDHESSLQAENFKKMLLTLSDDVRVIFIKLADRLHNMRTLESMPLEKQTKVAGETLFLYAPLAHRLGLFAIKTELEDLSLKYQHPAVFDEITKRLKESERKRLSYINKFSLPIINRLEESNIKFSITGRSKSIYSIWNKMQKKNVPFEEIYDIFAIRIIFEPNIIIDEKNICFDIYSIITDIYQPNPARLRDWVNTPKANGYEALHTTVMGPEGKWVEVQIRSRRMEEIAELGYAAHWKYKGEKADESELDKWIKKIRDLLESPDTNALEFLDEFKLNLFSSEIYVFTPKGLLVRLPKSSTIIDFAYEIHTQIGDKAIGAKVNHKLEPLSYTLRSGDQVEVLTSDKQEPQIDWLDFAITAKAKTCIKDRFKNERKNNLEKGKTIIENKFKELNINANSIVIKNLLSELSLTNKDDLYIKVGANEINIDEIKNILNKKSKSKWIKFWQLSYNKTASQLNIKKIGDNILNIGKSEKLENSIEIKEDNNVIAKCCKPIPGDEIVGFNNIKEIIIHKKKCPNAIKLMSSFGDKIVSVNWTTHKVLSYLVRIKLNGIDKVGIVNQITNIISEELAVNMRTIYFDSVDGVFNGYIDIYVHNTYDLEVLIHDIKKVNGVNSVTRVENIEDDIVTN